ncbi:Fic family protein [Patescibacteria group bacterium]|nr:Fic family protein [Patescibacteria group bacterium]
MRKLSKRQQDILDLIRRSQGLSNRKIREEVSKKYGEVSRVTVVRDMELLLRAGLVEKKGQGRSLVYVEKITIPLLEYVAVDDYFRQEQDQRQVKYERFNWESIGWMGGVFDQRELKNLADLNKEYQLKVKKMSKAAWKKELGRWLIELAWKSSQIEGNTYSLLDTEVLIKEKKEAAGHSREEAIMILNHKKALEYILGNRSKFKILRLRQIEDVHRMLVKDLGVAAGLRQKIVRVVGTNYRPLDNVYQIKEAMEKMVKKINKLSDPFSKSLLAIMFLSYIQPFEDGNKRTSRLVGNAVLLANGLCPLSLRTIDEVEYKKAMILFYEQNSVRYFKELFMEQFGWAVKNYF